jgi:UDP-N-acetylmuramate-alanine ligase
VLLTDIFPSAREKADDSVSSDSLGAALAAAAPTHQVLNLHTTAALAAWLAEHTRPGDVVLSLGAGDIYQFYELL